MDELTFIRLPRSDREGEEVGLNLSEVSTYSGKILGRVTRVEMRNGSVFPIAVSLQKFESYIANVIAP